jgi:hypothetical protein
MTKLRKVSALLVKLIAVAVVGLVIVVVKFVHDERHPPPPESQFRELFSDMSIAPPEYQKLQEITHPSDAAKGDYCILTFTQSESQFHRFVKNLGTSEEKVLSSSPEWVRVNSKLDPKYPWLLCVSAELTNMPEKTYVVHIDGRQPYD